MPEYSDIFLMLPVALLLVAVLIAVIRLASRVRKSQNKLREEIISQMASENHFMRDELEAKVDRLRSSHMQMFEAGRDSQRKRCLSCQKTSWTECTIF